MPIQQQFNPNDEYGHQFPVEAPYESLTDESAVVLLMHGRAMGVLPIGTEYEIRLAIPVNWGRTRSIAWYYSPHLAETPIQERFDHAPNGSYIFFGRYIVNGSLEVS